jgi:hypothetical protein
MRWQSSTGWTTSAASEKRLWRMGRPTERPPASALLVGVDICMALLSRQAPGAHCTTYNKSNSTILSAY